MRIYWRLFITLMSLMIGCFVGIFEKSLGMGVIAFMSSMTMWIVMLLENLSDN